MFGVHIVSLYLCEYQTTYVPGKKYFIFLLVNKTAFINLF